MILRTEEVPDQHRQDRVGRDQDRHENQRQAPDLDVVREENHHREADDQHQPAARGIHALRVFDGRGRRQTQALGELCGRPQAVRDQPLPVAVDPVDQADRLHLDEVGH
jgi:hypothetical protein